MKHYLIFYPSWLFDDLPIQVRYHNKFTGYSYDFKYEGYININIDSIKSDLFKELFL